MALKKEEVIFNEVLHSTLTRLHAADGSCTNQILYVIKRANLPSSVVLAAISLLLSAKEKLPMHICALKKLRHREKLCFNAVLDDRIKTALGLCDSSYMLFSISLIISSKYLIDRSYINRTWSSILMVDRALVNEYERCVLEVFEYKIAITSSLINDLRNKITGAAKKEKKENKLVRSIKKIMTCIFKNS